MSERLHKEYLDGRIQVVQIGRMPRYAVKVDGEEVKRCDALRLRTHQKYQAMIARGSATNYARGLADAAEVLG